MTKPNENASSFQEIRSLDKNGTVTQIIKEGLTKRELFAALIMSGFAGNDKSAGWTAEECAGDAIAWADILIDRLAKEQP